MPILTLNDGIICQINGITLEALGEQVRDGQYRLRTSQFKNIADLRFTSTVAEQLLWTENSTGNGNSTVLTEVKALRMSVGVGGVSNSITVESTGRYPAIPPYSQLVWFGIKANNPAPLDGTTRRFGIYDNTDGIYLELSSVAEPAFHIINTAVPQNITISRSNWDDPLDGTGISGITVDADNLQQFFLEYSWGGGFARFGVLVEGVPYLAHSEYWGNNPTYTQAMFKSPNLPVRFELENDGTTAAEMDVYFATIQADSGQSSAGIVRSIDRGNLGSGDVTIDENYHSIIGIRLKSTAETSIIRLNRIFSMCTSGGNIHYVLVLNPVPDAALTWIGLNNSALEYALPGNAIEFTYDIENVLASGYFSNNMDAALLSLENTLISLNIDSTGTNIREIHLLAANAGATANENLFGGIEFTEQI